MVKINIYDLSAQAAQPDDNIARSDEDDESQIQIRSEQQISERPPADRPEAPPDLNKGDLLDEADEEPTESLFGNYQRDPKDFQLEKSIQKVPVVPQQDSHRQHSTDRFGKLNSSASSGRPINFGVIESDVKLRKSTRKKE